MDSARGAAVEIAASRVREIDCFLAVTDFYGRPERLGDFRSRPLEMRAYRATVHLKHRAGRKEPFGAAGRPAALSRERLADIARATSAFPVAFEPVLLRAEDMDDRFTVRGSYFEERGSSWFIDGGVLDNKPFTAVLPAIYQRHADRPVERLLFFVEPDPEDLREVARKPEGPNFAEIGVAALMTLPSYQSIQSNLKDLDRHNRRLDLLETVFGTPYSSPRRGSIRQAGPRTERPSDAQVEVYWRARAHHWLHRMTEDLSQARVAGLGDAPATEGADGRSEREVFARFFTTFFESAFARRDGDLVVTRGAADIGFDELDLFFVMRAYYYWIYQLYGYLDQGAEGEPAEVQGRIRYLCQRVDMLLFLEARLFEEAEATGTAPTAEVLFDTCLRVLARGGDARRVVVQDWRAPAPPSLSGETELSDPDRFVSAWRSEAAALAEARPVSLLTDFLDALNRSLAGSWGLAEPRGEGAGATAPRGRAPALAPPETAPSAVQEFRAIDMWRFPALELAELGEMDRIEYYRISPRDSTGLPESLPELGRWDADPMTKVAGRQLYHFGAFLKRSWRSNDILWGRLDASAVLWRALQNRSIRMDAKRVAALRQSPDFARLDPELRALIEAYGDAKLDARRFATSLLRWHQRAILSEEIPRVIEDALDEEVSLRPPLLRTKRHRSVAPGPAPAVSTSAAGPAGVPVASPEATGDQAYLQAATRVLDQFDGRLQDSLLRRIVARGLSDVLVRRGGSLKSFFHLEYDVGSERVSDLDRLSLAITGLHAASVLSHMFKHLIPEKGAGGWFQKKVLGRVSIGITTLLMGAQSIRDEVFPMLWLAVVSACLSLILLQLLGPAAWNLPRWPTLYVPTALLAVLFGLPAIWFGRLVAILRLTLLAVVVGFAFWFGRAQHLHAWLESHLARGAFWVALAIGVLALGWAAWNATIFWTAAHRRRQIRELVREHACLDENRERLAREVERLEIEADQRQRARNELQAAIDGLKRKIYKLDKRCHSDIAIHFLLFEALGEVTRLEQTIRNEQRPAKLGQAE
jgi:patatin-related protein